MHEEDDRQEAAAVKQGAIMITAILIAVTIVLSISWLQLNVK
jgi:hypothetical protein